jgi:hypothetical protein
MSDKLRFMSAPAVGRHALRSDYVEVYWLPVIGPTSTCVLRTLGSMLAPGQPLTIEADTLAGMMGVGHRDGNNSPFARTLRRLVGFQILSQWDETTWAVPEGIGSISRHQLAALPELLQTLHAIWEEPATADAHPLGVGAIGTRV